MTISFKDVRAAADRIAGHTRPLAVAPLGDGASDGAFGDAFGGAEGWLALEFMQHTGSFKARGAFNFVSSHVEAGLMPDAGVVIASGGNAGLACAWAAARHGVAATVFVPETAPAVKVDKLRQLGATVRQVGTEYAQALAASQEFAAGSGALQSHAYDHPLVAAGAGTVMEELIEAQPGIDTVLVSVGGGGLFTGIAVSALEHGVRVVTVEPERCCALYSALDAGAVVDVPVDSVAADALGARRVSETALEWGGKEHVRSVLVTDEAIVSARRALWDDRRLVVEHAAATALAAVTSGVYVPSPGERVAVILCGANTDPSDLTQHTGDRNQGEAR
ncbi:threonine/serine dehydratase [Streptomyces sp. NPDC046821]|uniref:threonine/serine dehydratase n=1 Tax=Streptomyces sp. NPDC046821 TaxID=3154702 RepID=UPI0033EE50A2